MTSVSTAAVAVWHGLPNESSEVSRVRSRPWCHAPVSAYRPRCQTTDRVQESAEPASEKDTYHCGDAFDASWS